MTFFDVLFFILLLLIPLIVIGMSGLFFAKQLWRPLLVRHNLEGINRGASRNLLFAGCMNGSADFSAQLNRCRRAFACLIAFFLIYVFFFMGFVALAFFLCVIVLNFVTARPYEITEEIK
ncbi:hypothetical protein [Ruegeria atlantica]|uniref:hypothetical protein n=1 Tax=Ruegeria atlantica TaxID=81569 RepID=UPI00147A6C0B|nr:hypothetical protein [Ruegeria atlantica]